jgi:hypothetical protein
MEVDDTEEEDDDTSWNNARAVILAVDSVSWAAPTGEVDEQVVNEGVMTCSICGNLELPASSSFVKNGRFSLRNVPIFPV